MHFKYTTINLTLSTEWFSSTTHHLYSVCFVPAHPIQNLTYLHGNGPAIFFLIAIRHVCPVHQLMVQELAPPHPRTGSGTWEEDSPVQPSLSVSQFLFFFASLIPHLCSRMCFVLVLARSHVPAQTNFALQHSVMLVHHALLLFPVPLVKMCHFLVGEQSQHAIWDHSN